MKLDTGTANASPALSPTQSILGGQTMSVIRNALARIFRSRETSTLHFDADVRTAAFMRPIIEKLLADGEDGDTYRAAINFWRYAERPPLAVYDGDVSHCQIDGPLQLAGNHALPLGGEIFSNGVTIDLDPFEANDLREHMRAAIERAILAWLADNGRRKFVPAVNPYDRPTADREAKAMIADWVARGEVMRPVTEGPDHV
ncbi:hypothetical protein [Sphingopyxis sp. USTB-05]|uniref:hypothetical protein n=1 Tax=Sphingopyxis sp. USTB-05 TaxID=2830667 RepID=UPI002078F566|nr:hypothetical protein [Sphingopyxis sp. USTB-05]USI76515.1 hypothetical protein KEC45_17425 [Sphingopyxis sp. USTB-05]